MMRLDVARIDWAIRSAARYIGASGVAAILLLALTVLFVPILLVPALVQLQAAKSAPAQVRMVEEARRPELQNKEQLDSFYRTFPARSSVPDAMEKLYAAASEHRINLDSGEYRLVSTKADYLLRYELVLPVKGDYVSIRKFVIQALVDVPTISLDNISFHRQKSDDVVVEAELRFTLFLRRE
ncbi:hypothetical protein [Duganella radicis]|uniref:Pilus assembly protein PilO n=1 Tax=Duganella radicis TaxID=551988 RepID=A0A6L6PN48_9BURK|nr:hypothetical protein [Duganella radicis]MTV40558.1 hypothetical protein [Duganella radicis]